jgi:hypothetical protein
MARIDSIACFFETSRRISLVIFQCGHAITNVYANRIAEKFE